MTDHAAPPAPAIRPLPGAPFRGNLRLIDQGEWAGWHQWAGNDPFEDSTGPFYVAHDEHGIVCGFRPAAHNRNGHGSIHGGCLMTFADFALFMLGASQGEEIHGVTVSMNSEFLAPAYAGQLLIGRGERIAGGRSLLFVRGVISADGAPVLSFSGVVKRVKGA
ncbi:PaaI family thioesterase [Novosphingobium sp.]|uniref:PaaI family thioesterase n=1 Tax=Novosphingobium sp. TaxID=1874826 RepID=UPI00334043F6